MSTQTASRGLYQSRLSSIVGRSPPCRIELMRTRPEHCIYAWGGACSLYFSSVQVIRP